MDEPACQLLGVLVGRCRLSLGKLHFQAHQSAKARDEFTLPGGMVAPDKHEMLCHDLLLIEAWREHVFSRLAAHVPEEAAPKCNYVLHHGPLCPTRWACSCATSTRARQ